MQTGSHRVVRSSSVNLVVIGKITAKLTTDVVVCHQKPSGYENCSLWNNVLYMSSPLYGVWIESPPLLSFPVLTRF